MFGKMLEFGLTEIIPSICTWTILGPVSCFSPSWIPMGTLSGALQWVMALGCNILCLLKWQVICLVHMDPSKMPARAFQVCSLTVPLADFPDWAVLLWSRNKPAQSHTRILCLDGTLTKTVPLIFKILLLFKPDCSLLFQVWMPRPVSLKATFLGSK